VPLTYLQSKKQIAWLIAFVFICYGIILIAHRSAIIPCLFSIILLLLLAFRSANQRNLLFMSVGAGLVMLLLLFLFFPFLLQQSVLSKESRIQAFTLHTLSGISNPHRVDTFHSRLILWKKHLINAFTKNPLGYGLSYATMAAEKFGQPRIGPHSYLISIIASCGLMAGILLIYIVWLCMKQIFRVVRTLEGDSVIYSVAASTIGLFVTFFMFGGDAGLYSIAPLTWFFVGWFSRYDDIQDSSLPLGIQI